MFTDRIRDLKIAGDDGDALFPGISGGAYSDDVSHRAILRCLLSKRGISQAREIIFDDYEAISLMTNYEGRGNGRFYDWVDYFFQSLRQNVFENNQIIIVPMDTYIWESQRDAFQDKTAGFVAKAKERGFEYKEVSDIEMYMKRFMRCVLFTSYDLNSTLILVDHLTLPKFHFLGSILPRYLPRYFEGEFKLDDEDKALVHALTLTSSNEFVRRVNEFSRRFDFRDASIDRVVRGVETDLFEKVLEGVKSKLIVLAAERERLLREYRENQKQTFDHRVRVEGLKGMIDSCSDEADSELVSYFKANKGLIPIGKDGSSFSFVVNNYLSLFDPEVYNTIVNRDRSCMWTDYSVVNADFSSRESRRILLDAIFGDEQKVKLKMCGFYCLYLDGCVDSCSGFNYPSESRDYLPNPHLQHYDCLGNYERMISERITAGDLLGAVTHCVSSTQSVNLAEGVTVSNLMGDLFSTGHKVIELPDGSSVSPSDALKWLTSKQ